MSDFKDFLRTRLFRHPTTWLLIVGAGVYGGVEMYQIRAAKRAAGQDLDWPPLGMERNVDFAFGAFIQVVVVLCSVWILAGLVENLNVWLRQLLLVIVYLLFVLLWQFM